MQNLDRDEKRIYDAFSAIKVDTNRLERNLENMNRPKRIKRRLTLIVAAVLIFVTLSATAYASVGGMDGFIARFNPEFGAFALPPLEPAYTEYDGIRIEIVGARIFEHTVLVYYTMEDVTGENRLTRYMRPSFEVFAHGEQLSDGGASGRRIHFDSENNRGYFESAIRVDGSIAWAGNNIEFRATRIDNFEHSGELLASFTGDWRIDVAIDDDSEETTIVWTNIDMGDFYIEYMALGVMGLRIMGAHDGHFFEDARAMSQGSATIELEGRLFNTRFISSGAGIGPNCFDIFFSPRSPIDMDAVMGVVVRGIHVPLP